MTTTLQLTGLRLALYDAAREGGPRGLPTAEMIARAQPPSWLPTPAPTPEACRQAMEWLRQQGWLQEYQPGRHRATTPVARLEAAPAPAYDPSRDPAHGQLQLFDTGRATHA